jgi:hypothetical protein
MKGTVKKKDLGMQVEIASSLTVQKQLTLRQYPQLVIA